MIIRHGASPLPSVPLLRGLLCALCTVCGYGCGDDGGGSSDDYPDLAWWEAAEPDGDCELPAAVDGPGIHFVAPDGDDGAAGTLDAPWGTLQHAAQSVGAGETVFLRGGTYTEVLSPAASGADGEWITFAAFPGEEPTIDGTTLALEAGTGLVHVDAQQYIRVCGLRAINAGPDDNANGILVDDSSHVVIGDCSTYNTRSSGIGVWNSDHIVIADNDVELACNDGDQECISVGTTDTFVVRGNHVHDSGPGTLGGEGIDVKDGSTRGLVVGNHVHDLQRLGIYAEAWDKHTHDLFIYGNLVHDNNGEGITLASEMGGLLQNIRVENNVAYNNACSGIGLLLNNEDPTMRHPIKNVRIFNNTLVDNGSDACSGNDWGGGVEIGYADVHQVVVRNNLTSQNLLWQIAVDLGAADAVTLDHNLVDGMRGELDEAVTDADSVAADPLFVDRGGLDFHLSAGSPAIDRGSLELAPARDFDGNERPRGAAPDLGAFEL